VLERSTIVQQLSKVLRQRLDATTHEPLPERWVELIQYLNEKERHTASGRQRRMRKHVKS
jgi:hypothetical protein